MNAIDQDAMPSDTPLIPGYEIYPDGLLGEGGFAKVYRARHKGFQIDVALKIMDRDLAKDPEFCKRFLREGRTCAKLGTHPHIMNIYEIGCVEDDYYFSMQLLEGPSLYGMLRNSGARSAKDNRHPLELLRPIVEALGYAHRNGFVHRDIKPANILFNEDGDAMLSDFGIAKSFSQHTLSTVGASIGTPVYMSPEQAKALPDIDGRSDLYSLGVVLFELLSGEPPYKSDTPMGTMLQHVNAPIPELPEGQKKFQPLIARLLAKEPDDRYRDSEALLVDLDRYIANLRKRSAFSRIIKSYTSKAVRWRVPLLSSVAGLVLLMAGSWYINSHDTDPISEGSQNEASDKSPAEIAEQIAALLERAELFEEVGDLVSPPGSNALEIYEQVLSIEPDQVKALRRQSELSRLLE